MIRVPKAVSPIFALLILLGCDSSTSSDDDNSGNKTPTGMKKVSMAGECFQMGSDNNTLEQPVHKVSFTKDLWVDSTEVTQKSYSDIMSSYYTNYESPEWADKYGVGDNYPAFNIYWDDAVLYCNAMSRANDLDTVYSYSSITGKPGHYCTLEDLEYDMSKNGYRLPTESEWEYLCRGGTITDFYWGKTQDDYNSDEVGQYAIWKGNSYSLGETNAAFGGHEVASNKPNSYGLYDMVGNVYEFCNDLADVYKEGDVTDPTGPESGNTNRIIRGGSWGNPVENLTSSWRAYPSASAANTPDYPFYYIGFRTVRGAE